MPKKFDKIANRVYHRLHRKYRGKNFPQAEFERELIMERFREQRREVSLDPSKTQGKRKQIFKFVDVTPQKRERVLEDFFVDPSKIPKSKRQKLDEAMKKSGSGLPYSELMKILEEEENDD